MTSFTFSASSFRPAAAFCIDGNDRTFKSRSSISNVDLMFLLFKNVDHRQRDDDRNAKFEKLRDEIKISFEICRVDDRDDHIGLRQTGLLAGYHLAGDLFVERRRVEAVQSGQVDEIR